MTIWKFPLRIADKVLIEMPAGAKLLTVQMQNGSPFIWASLDEKEPLGLRRVYVRGTGHELYPAEPHRYVGTFQQGPFVWHVFDGGPAQ